MKANSIIKLSILSIVLVVAVSSCDLMGLKYKNVSASGKLSTARFDVDRIKQIEVSHGMKLFISKGDSTFIKVTSDDNIAQFIEVYSVGRKLSVRVRNGVNITNNPTMIIHAYTDNLTELITSGGTVSTLVDTVKSDTFVTNISGGGFLYGPMKVKTLTANLSGGSEIHTAGTADYAAFNISGGGRFTDYDFTAKRTAMNLSGGAEVDMSVSENIEILASGGSHLRYKGNAKVSYKGLSGGSTITRVE